MCSSIAWHRETSKVVIFSCSDFFVSVLQSSLFCNGFASCSFFVDFILSVDFRMTFSLCKEDSFLFSWGMRGTRGVTTIGIATRARSPLYLSLVNWYRVSIYLYFYLPFAAAAAAIWGGEIRGTHVCVWVGLFVCEGERLIFNDADDKSNCANLRSFCFITVLLFFPTKLPRSLQVSLLDLLVSSCTEIKR